MLLLGTNCDFKKVMLDFSEFIIFSSFFDSPTDAKFASCSDDGTVRVWDFFSCTEERVLRGHGSDVRCVDWHPTKVIFF